MSMVLSPVVARGRPLSVGRFTLLLGLTTMGIAGGCASDGGGKASGGTDQDIVEVLDDIDESSINDREPEVEDEIPSDGPDISEPEAEEVETDLFPDSDTADDDLDEIESTEEFSTPQPATVSILWPVPEVLTRGLVAVRIRAIDADGGRWRLALRFSIDGVNFRNANLRDTLDAPRREILDLAPGTPQIFAVAWEAERDVLSGAVENVTLAVVLRPESEADGPGDANAEVVFRLDAFHEDDRPVIVTRSFSPEITVLTLAPDKSLRERHNLVPGSSGKPATRAVFSPDGRNVILLFKESPRVTELIVAEDGTAAVADEFDLAGGWPGDAAFSPDGLRLYLSIPGAPDVGGAVVPHLRDEAGRWQPQTRSPLSLVTSLTVMSTGWVVAFGGKEFPNGPDWGCLILDAQLKELSKVSLGYNLPSSTVSVAEPRNPDQPFALAAFHDEWGDGAYIVTIDESGQGQFLAKARATGAAAAYFHPSGRVLAVPQAEPNRVSVFPLELTGHPRQAREITGIGLAAHSAMVRGGEREGLLLVTMIPPNAEDGRLAPIHLRADGTYVRLEQYSMGVGTDRIPGNVAVGP